MSAAVRRVLLGFVGQVLAFHLPKVFLIPLVKRLCCTFGLVGSCVSHTLKYNGKKKTLTFSRGTIFLLWLNQGLFCIIKTKISFLKENTEKVFTPFN